MFWKLWRCFSFYWWDNKLFPALVNVGVLPFSPFTWFFPQPHTHAKMTIQLKTADLCSLSSLIFISCKLLPSLFPQLKDINKFPPGFLFLLWQLKAFTKEWTRVFIVLTLIICPLSDPYSILPKCPKSAPSCFLYFA